VIESERLVLRPLTEDDWDQYLPIHTDPDVMRFVGGRYDEEFVRQRFERMCSQWIERGLGHWATFEKQSEKLVGAVGLMQHDDWTATPYNIEVGWLIGKDYWNRGYATEAAQPFVPYAFDRLGIERLICIVAPENISSRRVAEKIGFRAAGETFWRDHQVIWHELDAPPTPHGS
jgi:[ribosomal protein S5]-alanine N-acetyltransferase